MPQYWGAPSYLNDGKTLVVWNPGANMGKGARDKIPLKSTFPNDPRITTEISYELTLDKVAVQVGALLRKTRDKLTMIVVGGDGAVARAYDGFDKASKQNHRSQGTVAVIGRGTAIDIARNTGSATEVTQAVRTIQRGIEIPFYSILVKLTREDGTFVERKIPHNLIMGGTPDFFRRAENLRSRMDIGVTAYALFGIPTCFHRFLSSQHQGIPVESVHVNGRKVLGKSRSFEIGLFKSSVSGSVLGLSGVNPIKKGSETRAVLVVIPREASGIKSCIKFLPTLADCFIRGFLSRVIPGILGKDKPPIAFPPSHFVTLKPGDLFTLKLGEPTEILANGDVLEGKFIKLEGRMAQEPRSIIVSPDSLEASLALPRMFVEHPTASTLRGTISVFGKTGLRTLRFGTVPTFINTALFMGMDYFFDEIGWEAKNHPFLRSGGTLAGLSGINWLLAQGWKQTTLASLLRPSVMGIVKGGLSLVKGSAVAGGLGWISGEMAVALGLVERGSATQNFVELASIGALTTYPLVAHRLLNVFVAANIRQALASGGTLASEVLMAANLARLMRVGGTVISAACLIGVGVSLLGELNDA